MILSRRLVLVAAGLVALAASGPSTAARFDPVGAAQISTVAPATTGQNDNKPDTTANSQNRLSHVANVAAVAGWANTAFPVEVDGTTAAGDNGRRKMTFDSANKCGAGGHPAADGYTCVNSTVVTTGSWNIDWASVGGKASPCLFENCLTAADDTAAIKAAVGTRMPVDLPVLGRSWIVSSDITVTTPGQIIEGHGRYGPSVIQVNAPGGFTNGVFSVASGEPGPRFRNFGIQFSQPDTQAYASFTQYVPAFYVRNSPQVEMDKMGCFFAIRCVDARGLNGGMIVDDFEYSAFYIGIDVDGMVAPSFFTRLRWYPYGMTTNQLTYFNNQASTNSPTAKSGNTGNGTVAMGAVAAFFPASFGTYRIVWQSATAFNVYNPAGTQIGNGTNGTTYSGQIRFTATAGSTAFVQNDEIDVTVTALQPIGMNVGRCDDCTLINSIMEGGLGMNVFWGTFTSGYNGAPAITLGDVDFDTVSGIAMSAGFLQGAKINFAPASNNDFAIQLSGGDMLLSTPFFYAGAAYIDSMVKTNGPATGPQDPAGPAATITMTSGTIKMNGANFIFMNQSGGTANVNNMRVFQALSASAYSQPVFYFGAGRTQFSFNYFTDQSTGTSKPAVFANDNPFNKVIGNSSPGWAAYAPTSPSGTYQFN